MSMFSARRGQGLDPRAVLLSMLFVVLAVKGLKDWSILLFAEAGLLLGVALLGIPLAPFLRRTLWVLPFCSAALPLLVTSPGTPSTILEPMGWTITDQGVGKFATILGQSVLCFQVLLIGSALKTPKELLWGLQALGCPVRLVTILGLCLRYLEFLRDDLQRLRWAASCRGARALGWVERFKLSGGLLGSLFVRSLDRAERVQVAMQCRGCPGSPALGVQQPPGRRWSAPDTVLTVLSLGLAGGVWLS